MPTPSPGPGAPSASAAALPGPGRTAAARCGLLVTVIAAVAGATGPSPSRADAPPAEATPSAAPAGDAGRGARLFSGEARLANGGPPCGTCHTAPGLPFPGGGTMGPDLGDAYGKYGPEPLDLVLTTLFFPTMDPIFAGRLLTPAERSDLVAFFAAAANTPPPRGATLRILAPGLAVFLVLAGVLAVLGRTRLRGVRAPLVRAANRRLRGGGSA